MGCVERSTGEALSPHSGEKHTIHLHVEGWELEAQWGGKWVAPDKVESGGAGPGSPVLAGHPATCHRGSFLSWDGRKPLRVPVIFCSSLDDALSLSS